MNSKSRKRRYSAVGRLIREGRIEPYDYNEISHERMRDYMRVPEFNALRGCNIQSCQPALHRSRFRQNKDFRIAVAKGGKKDGRAGTDLGSTNQIPCLDWLCSLPQSAIDWLIANPIALGGRISDFEIENLKTLPWFQFLCERSGSPENYPLF